MEIRQPAMAKVKRKFAFGTRGIWHSPASEENNIKAQDIPVVVLEETKEGVLYIFTMRSIRRGWNNLTYRTATIFPSDFTPDINDVLKSGFVGDVKAVTPVKADIGNVLPKVTIHCPKHGVSRCVGIENGIMCEFCFRKA